MRARPFAATHPVTATLPHFEWFKGSESERGRTWITVSVEHDSHNNNAMRSLDEICAEWSYVMTAWAHACGLPLMSVCVCMCNACWLRQQYQHVCFMTRAKANLQLVAQGGQFVLIYAQPGKRTRLLPQQRASAHGHRHESVLSFEPSQWTPWNAEHGLP